MANGTMDIAFVSCDGDAIGQKIGRATLADSPDDLSAISEKIKAGNDMIVDWAESVGGKIFTNGGDEVTAAIPKSALEELEAIRKDYEFITGCTLSMGVGSKLSEAAKALHVAKLRGKNQIGTYDEKVESEWQKAEEETNNGTATGEAKKLGDAYMKKNEDQSPVDPKAKSKSAPVDHEHSEDDCKYCNEAEGVDQTTDESDHDCQYCAEAEQNQDDPTDCEYCNEADGAGPDHDHEDTDCQYCNEANDADVDQSAENGNPSEDAGNVEDADGDSVEQSPDSNANTPEGMQQVLGQLETDGSEPNDPAEIATQFDDTADVGNEMQDNVSRPDDYDTNTPSDMGMAEDDEDAESGPDLSSVLQGGLDNHAQNMQKQKVVELVGQALEGFKANKQILEKAKEQAPDFYNASISMLKAMIEMAGMLGLGDDAEQSQDSPLDPEQDQESDEKPQDESGKPQADWDNPFPQHPGTKGGDKKPAPGKPGEKQSPKPVSQQVNLLASFRQKIRPRTLRANLFLQVP